MNSDYNELLDFIFYTIRESRGINIEDIYNHNRSEFKKLSKDELDLEFAVNNLIEKRLICKDKDNGFFVSPKYASYRGLSASNILKVKKENRKRRYDEFKVYLPIFISIVIGITSLLLSFHNYKSTNDINKIASELDSLKNEIRGIIISNNIEDKNTEQVTAKKDTLVTYKIADSVDFENK